MRPGRLGYEVLWWLGARTPGQERDAIIAWTLQCVARQPEAIAGTMLRCH